MAGKGKPSNKPAGKSATEQSCDDCDCTEAIKGACEPTVDENRVFKANQDKINARKKKYNARHKGKDKTEYPPRKMTWKDKHCGPVMYKYELPDGLDKKLEKMKGEIEDLQELLEDQIEEMLKNAGMKKVERVLEVQGCAVLGAAIGGVFGFFFGAGIAAAPAAAAGAAAGEALCGTAATAEAVIDTAKQVEILHDLKKQFLDKFAKELKRIEKLKELAARGKKIAELRKKKEDKKITASEQEELKRLEDLQKKAKDHLYKVQEKLINRNKCLTAKRCQIRPFNEQNKGQKSSSEKMSPRDQAFGLNNPNGCCPGQTAHHIIPNTKIENCGNYDKTKHYNKAPAVCVEGGKDAGTHGKMHDNTDKNTTKMVFSESKESPACNGKANTMTCTIDASTKAFVKTFKKAGCDDKCIAEILAKAYKEIEKCELTPQTKGGHEIKRDDEEDDGGK